MMTKYFTIAVALAFTVANNAFAEQIDVKGKVVVVTGASRGIGEATARVLGAAGMKVVLAARSVDKLENVKSAIVSAGGEASAIKCDVSVASEVKAMIDFASDTYGGVDFVFANAGWEGYGKVLEETPDDEIEKVIDINILGYLYTMKYAIKAFKARGGGAIIFVSSVGAIIPRHMFLGDEGAMRTVVPYTVTKAANDFTARVGAAWAKDGIRSYGILPGAFQTTMLENLGEEVFQLKRDELGPLGGFNPWVTTHIGDPVHIGHAALAMFDNSTTYQTGETAVCDNWVTFRTDTFYQHMHKIHDPNSAHGNYQFPNKDEFYPRDAKGNKYVAPKDDL